MATSIPGGAFLAADKKTWIDSEGKPLSKDQIKAAEQLHAEHADANDAAEQTRLEFEASKRTTIVVREPAAKKKD
jgi:hypothetical protein